MPHSQIDHEQICLECKKPYGACDVCKLEKPSVILEARRKRKLQQRKKVYYAKIAEMIGRNGNGQL
jgi:hypothetical protein